MIWDASSRARWTLIGAAVGSVLLLGLTALVLRPGKKGPPLSFAEPWEPPSAAAPAVFTSEPSHPATAAATRQTATRRPTARPPATHASSRRPTPTTPPAAPNLSLRADGEADGSTKAEGTSFKAPVSLRKITFVILGADGTPRVAEYETFAR